MRPGTVKKGSIPIARLAVLAGWALLPCARAQSGSFAAVAPHPVTTGVPAPSAPSENHPKRMAAAGPLVGFTFDTKGLGIDPLTRSGATVSLEPPINLPEDVTAFYLPPRQMYALVERRNQSLSLLHLDRYAAIAPALTATPLSKAIAQPSAVFFSPRGDSAAFYDSQTDRLEVVSNLPAEPTFSELAISGLGSFSQIAISDDGSATALYSPARGILLSENGGSFHPLSAPFAPSAWSFLPQSHTLVLYDAAQQVFATISNAKLKVIPARNAHPDRLLPEKDGAKILAAAESGKVWLLDLQSNTIHQLNQPADWNTLELLRDGHTFLLSASNGTQITKTFLGEGQ